LAWSAREQAAAATQRPAIRIRRMTVLLTMLFG
jgi:hypothetical protein